MAKRQGFVGNRKVIGSILRDDPGVGAALDEIAEQTAARAGGEVVAYVTDRQVRKIVVDADEQAVNGAATKAINEVRGFVSRRQWRRGFSVPIPGAAEYARATKGGYRSLPEKKGS